MFKIVQDGDRKHMCPRVMPKKRRCVIYCLGVIQMILRNLSVDLGAGHLKLIPQGAGGTSFLNRLCETCFLAQ